LVRRALLTAGLSAGAGFVLGRLTGDRQEVELHGATDVGVTYHEWSKPGYSQALGAVPDWGSRPDQAKVYPDAERIPLPEPRGWQGLSVAAAIDRRRSQRTYASGQLAQDDLSRLLHAASGITDPASGFRAAPSAGALYPMETYAVIHEVVGLEAGLYHYVPARHELERLRSGDLRAAIVVAGIGQEMLAQAQLCIVLSAIFQRTRWRYHERAYRYILLEAGHIAQNIYLSGTALGLGVCAVGAFFDDDLNRLLRIDGKDEAALYILAVGRP
jgi:SagB-type dehydrogenase family enzyme